MATFVWAAASAGNWSVGSNWKVGGVAQSNPPTTADAVQLGTGTGATQSNCTVDATANCLSLDCTGYTGTLTHTAAVALNVTGTLFKLVVGMTYTSGTSATINLSGLCAFTTAGKNIQPNVWMLSGGTLSVQDTWTNCSASLTMDTGTFTTNNNNMTFWHMANNASHSGTFNLGSSTITLQDGVAPWAGTALWTVNAGTSTIILSGASAPFSSAGKTYNNVQFTGSGTPIIQDNAATYTAVTRTGTAVKTDGFKFNVSSITIGTLNINSNSVTNRMLVTSDVVGTQRTITVNTAVSLTNTDFMDIKSAGTAGTWTGTSLGDCGGNSGITFDTPVTQTWSGNTTGNWSTAANWTSRVPLPQDNVAINGLTSGTVTVDMTRIAANIDFTGSTGGTWALPFGTVPNHNAYFFGDLKLVANLTTSGTASIYASGRGSQTATFAGVTLTASLGLQAPGGTYTLDGAGGTFSNGISIVAGTLDASVNNPNISAFNFQTSGTLTKTISLGSGTWTLTSTGTVWSVPAGNGNTLNQGTGTILISDTSNVSKTFAGGGRTYNNLTVTGSKGANVFITGANTFSTVTVTNPDTVVTLSASVTNTVTSFNATGQNNGYLYLNGNANNYTSSPNIAAYNITGDIDVRSQIVLDNWRPTSTLACGPTMDSGGTNRQYALRIVNGGFMNFYKSSTGSGANSASSSVAIPTSVTAQWIRATWVSATGVTTFYTSPDNSTWTQLGTTQVLEAGTAIFSGTSLMTIGASLGSGIAPGQYYRLQVYNGIGGTLVYDADFTAKAFGANTFTESSSNAATVTINGAQAQAGDGRILINSSIGGTKATLSSSSRVALDYVTVTDNTAAGTTPFYSGAHSVLSNTTNWNATAAPMGGGSLLTLGVG